jgi:gamma-glutamylputrescine oxidase
VSETGEAIGTRAYTASVYEPNAGHVHPIKLVHVLKLAAEAAGVNVYEDSPVLTVEEGPVTRLHTALGQTVTAGSLVLATNAFTSKGRYRDKPTNTPRVRTSGYPTASARRRSPRNS